MNGTPAIKPKIDDLYWFNYSEKIVNNAVENQDKAAGKLQNLALWFWGIYTAYAAVGFVLSKKQLEFWTTFWIAAASASLIAVYWSTVWVQMPILVAFDPRSPTDIKQAYTSTVEAKSFRLKVTLLLSVLAAIMVSLSLIISSVAKEPKETKLAFGASILSTKDARRMLAVTGTVGDARTVTVSVKPISSKRQPSESRNYVFMPAEKGLLQTSILLEPDARMVEVTLEWRDSKGMSIQLSREVCDP